MTDPKGFMKHARFSIHHAAQALAIAATMMFSTAHADEYAEVSQLARAGKFAEASAKADQFLAGKPKDPQMRFLKGVVQRDSGKISEAISTFTRLTEDYPELPEPYNNLAVLYASQSQFDKARMSLEMAIRTNPSYSTAHENLGDVYAKLASQAYNKALQLDTNNQGVPPKLALIRELFNPGAKGQRPTAAATLPSAQANLPTGPGAGTASVKPAPTLPTPAAARPAQPPTVAAAAASAPVAPAVVASARPASASATTPATASVAATTSAPAANSGREVEAAIQAWASAWAAKDVRAYLASYGRDFDPPGNQKRGAWEEERKQRILGKSKISVKVEGLSVKVEGNKATAKFRQDYRADGVFKGTRKVMELTKVGDRWLIVRESTGN